MASLESVIASVVPFSSWRGHGYYFSHSRPSAVRTPLTDLTGLPFFMLRLDLRDWSEAILNFPHAHAILRSALTVSILVPSMVVMIRRSHLTVSST